MKFACTEEYFIQTFREEGELVFIGVYYYYWLWIAFLNWISWSWEPFDKAKYYMIESWNANLVLWGSMGVQQMGEYNFYK